MNTIYHLPTQAHEDDFLKQAENQGVTWSPNLGNRVVQKPWSNGFDFIRVNNNFLAGYDKKPFYEDRFPELPIIEWKLGFTKADMQIGQAYKMRNGVKLDWEKSDIDYYTDDLKHKFYYDFDIIEVYPLNIITLIWKREEPKKYRVKNELTQGQAEKLGLDLCEVIE